MSNLSTRQRILEASRQLFNERGYAGTTLARIATQPAVMHRRMGVVTSLGSGS